MDRLKEWSCTYKNNHPEYVHRLKCKLDEISKDAPLLTGEDGCIMLDPMNPHHVEWFEEESGLDRIKGIARRAMANGNFTVDDVIADLKEYRMSKHMDFDNKTTTVQAGGSLKTKNSIDAQEICREVRGKV